MYCILVTGMPASGKSTMADFLGRHFSIPVFSKDRIKEIGFDTVGFSSRQEKVRLGYAAMEMMYYAAEQLMKAGQPFLLENNFENSSKAGMVKLLDRYHYTAVTVRMTGDFEAHYKRFLKRNASPDRHRGHVVNSCYPEKEGERKEEPLVSLEDFKNGIRGRGMDTFAVSGPLIEVDTTCFDNINKEEITHRIQDYIEMNAGKLYNRESQKETGGINSDAKEHTT